MAIALRGTATNNTAAGAAALTLTHPSGLTADDLLVAVVGKDDDPAITSDHSWSLFTGCNEGSTTGNDHRSTVWYKKATAADVSRGSSSWAGDAGEDWSGVCIALSGADGDSPEDVTPTTSGLLENDSTPASPAITPSTAGAWVIAAVVSAQADTGGHTAPSNMTATASPTTGTGNGDNGSSLAYYTGWTSGAFTPNDWTNAETTAESHAYTIAIKPAGASQQDLTGTTFQKAGTFAGGGTVTVPAQLRITAVELAGTYTAGASTQNLTGTTFQKAPTFNVGTLTAGSFEVGPNTLYQKAPTFGTGTLTKNREVGPNTLYQQAPTFNVGALVVGAVEVGPNTTYQQAPSFFAGVLTKNREIGPNTTFQKAPAFNVGTLAASYTLTGVLFQRAPTFNVGAVGVGSFEVGPNTLYQQAPTFFVGVISLAPVEIGPNTTYQQAPTFNVGVVAVGSFEVGPNTLYTKAPTFPVGTVATGSFEVGPNTLYTKAPTFGTGTVDQPAGGAQNLTGSLFQKAPTFNVGATAVGPVALTGSVYQQAPTFNVGAVGGLYALTGSLFAKAPTFNVGTTATSYVLTGVLFQKAPAFFAGVLTWDIPLVQSTAFQQAPTFFVGATTGGGVIALTGTTFQKAPTFNVGIVWNAQLRITAVELAGVYTADPNWQGLTGALFQKTPVFNAGAVVRPGTLEGTSTFQKTPTFPVGVVAGPLTGVVFQKAPTFFLGDVIGGITPGASGFYFANYDASYELVLLQGATFQRAPTFFVGYLTGQQDLGGVLFQKAPTFFVGAVASGSLEIGPNTTYQQSPTFNAGAVDQPTPTQNLTGALFQKAPSFIGGGTVLGGTLEIGPNTTYQQAPTFFGGVVAGPLTGVTFQKAPSFSAGIVSDGGKHLYGSLFQRTGTFPGSGTVASTYGITGDPFGWKVSPFFHKGMLAGGGTPVVYKHRGWVYRVADPNNPQGYRIHLVPATRTVRKVGWSGAEGWEVVSDKFRYLQDEAGGRAVMDSLFGVDWSGTQAQATTNINAALTTGGFLP